MKRILMTVAAACLLIMGMASVALAEEDQNAPVAAEAPGTDEAPAAAPADETAGAQEPAAQPAAQEDQADAVETPAAVPAPLPQQPLSLSPTTPVIAERQQLDFLELDGYMRVRWDLFHNLDLEALTPLKPGCRPTDDGGETCSDLFMGTNMRFSVRPTLNISEDIRIIGRVDMLDNIVLGSTPDPYGFDIRSVQYPARVKVNSDRNSIEIKSLYGEVMLPFGMVRFGRQAFDWGLGMYFNDGSCVDCDQGDFVDRVSFATEVFDHVMFATWDFPNEGITMHNTLLPIGQDKDPFNGDDIGQWTFGFMRKDSPEEIEEKLLNDEIVFNYGMLNLFRIQDYDTPAAIEAPVAADGTVAAAGTYPDGNTVVKRGLFMYMADVWAKLLWRDLHLEIEGALITGNIDNVSDFGEAKKGADLLQWGLVLQADYSFMDRTLLTGFEFGIASGDSDPGWGIAPILSNGGDYRAGRQYANDGEITNFRFDPDYAVDLILFREILTTVSDATYLKLMTEYRPAPGFGVRLEAIYSMVLEPASSPYYDSDPTDTNGIQLSVSDIETNKALQLNDSHQLGLELDLHLYYKSPDGFFAGVSYGIFFPGAALGRIFMTQDDNGVKSANWDAAGGVAQTVQGTLGIYF